MYLLGQCRLWLEICPFLKLVSISCSTKEDVFISLCQMTLLHMAAEEGHLDIVKYLVKKGAYKDTKNQSKVSIGDCTTKQIYPLIEDTSACTLILDT